MAMEALKLYPETLAADMELLQDKNLSYNKRNILLFRSAEKRVCISYEFF